MFRKTLNFTIIVSAVWGCLSSGIAADKAIYREEDVLNTYDVLPRSLSVISFMDEQATQQASAKHNALMLAIVLEETWKVEFLSEPHVHILHIIAFYLPPTNLCGMNDQLVIQRLMQRLPDQLPQKWREAIAPIFISCWG